MNKRRGLLLLGLILILTITMVYQSSIHKTIESALESQAFYNIEIGHVADSEQGLIVFFTSKTYPDQMLVGYFKKNIIGYWLINSASIGSFDDDRSLTSSFISIGESNQIGSPKSLNLIGGLLINSKIQQIELTYKNGESQTATIVDTEIGRLWYAVSGSAIAYLPQALAYDEYGVQVH